MKKLMIYGAAGYTGGMAAEHAAAAGLPLVLVGFEGNRADLAAHAARLGAETRIFCPAAAEVWPCWEASPRMR